MNEVEAVKSKEKIDEITHYLTLYYTNDAYADFWRLNLNLALRVSDLLKVKYTDFDLKNKRLILRESKTGKKRNIRLNQLALTIIDERLNKYPEDEFLFQGRSNRNSGKPTPLSRQSVTKAFKEISKVVGVNFNTHSCRKTRGFMLRQAGIPIETISKMLNHNDTKVTMRYIGLDQDEIDETFDIEI